MFYLFYKRLKLSPLYIPSDISFVFSLRTLFSNTHVRVPRQIPPNCIPKNVYFENEK